MIFTRCAPMMNIELFRACKRMNNNLVIPTKFDLDRFYSNTKIICFQEKLSLSRKTNHLWTKFITNYHYSNEQYHLCYIKPTQILQFCKLFNLVLILRFICKETMVNFSIANFMFLLLQMKFIVQIYTLNFSEETLLKQNLLSGVKINL